MPKRETGDPSDPEELRKHFEDLIAGMDLEDLKTVASELLSYSPSASDVVEAMNPPSRRRGPRRVDTLTYQVRVDLVGSRPPIWRRLEVASDLFLNTLHDVVQTAFGWTDSHLHVFTLSDSPYDRGAERYLCPFEVEEGEEGIPAKDVRLDEVFVDVGDTLLYEYDFGDGWTHKVKLEKVLPHVEEAPDAVCTGGRRAGPPEDSGGVNGYESMLAGASDPSHPDHEESVDRLEHYLGPGPYDPTHFDIAVVNESMAAMARFARTVSEGSPLGTFLGFIRGSVVAGEFDDMLAAAALDEPVLVAVEDAARMVRRYAWLLERVGNGGIKLTSAGYLPPVHVEAAVADLGMEEEWIGKMNREVQTLPVLRLRESAQQMGLLRKYRGTLLPTKAGASLANDPVALWWHIASRLPFGKQGTVEQQAGLATLLAVAAGRVAFGGQHRRLLTEVLTGLGWRTSAGRLDEWAAYGAARDTLSALRDAEVFTSTDVLRDAAPTSQGRALARAALSRLARG